MKLFTQFLSHSIEKEYWILFWELHPTVLSNAALSALLALESYVDSNPPSCPLPPGPEAGDLRQAEADESPVDHHPPARVLSSK